MDNSDKKILTCLVKDDLSNFFLLYRKLVSADFDIIGINTAYNRKDQKFVMDQPLMNLFPKIAYLGPTPIYEDYVTMANFPRNIDLNEYKDNIVNINIIEHLKHHALSSIFPNQKTRYHHPLQIQEELFNSALGMIDKDYINLAINIFDPMYDPDIMLQYDITYCINTIIKAFPDKKVRTYLVGMIHSTVADGVDKILIDTFASLKTEVISWTDKSLSEQLALLLSCNLFISGSYGLGFLAYTAKVPTFIIYPYHLDYLRGRTIDQIEDTHWYIETTDTDLFVDINKAVNLIKEK